MSKSSDRQSLRILHQRQVHDSSIVRFPSSDQMRSYSRRASTSVGCGGQSMPDMPQALEGHRHRSLARPEHRAEIHDAGEPTAHRWTVPTARVASAASRSSAACSAPVQTSQSARCNSSSKASSCRRSHASSGSSAAPEVRYAQRRGIGRRRLGAPASGQVQFGELLAFLGRRDQRRAAIELVDDLEDRLVALFRWRVRREQPADRRCVSARDSSGISA